MPQEGAVFRRIQRFNDSSSGHNYINIKTTNDEPMVRNVQQLIIDSTAVDKYPRINHLLCDLLFLIFSTISLYSFMRDNQELDYISMTSHEVKIIDER